jgi:hypothetical protein
MIPEAEKIKAIKSISDSFKCLTVFAFLGVMKYLGVIAWITKMVHK